MVTFTMLKEKVLPGVAEKRDRLGFKTQERSRYQKGQSPVVPKTDLGLKL